MKKEGSLTYTTEIHVQRVKKMIKLHEENCDECCPALTNFLIEQTTQDPYANSPCPVCCGFVGISFERECPCGVFGRKKAVAITKRKIKEWEKRNGK